MDGDRAVAAPESTRSRRCGAALATLVLAPFVALLIWALDTTLYSTGDVALTELLVRDVGGAHTPLLGAYSRYGWHHPGPLFFYVLAAPFRALGSDGTALVVGAVLLDALAVLAAVGILWRRGRLGGLLVGALGIAVLVHSLGGDVLASPWNPVATVMPMLVLVLAVWSVTCGDAWMLPVVVGVGSFVAQTHVGAVPVVLAALAVACVAVVVTRRGRTGDRTVWLVALAVGFVLWIPPVVDALAHRGGNLRRLASFWASSHGHVTGWSRAARIVGAELAVDAPWITGRLPRRGFFPGVEPGWTVPVVGILLVVALVWALRRGVTDAVRLGGVTVGFAAVAWISVARIVDEPFDYLVRWTELTGLLVALTLGWIVLEQVRTRAPASFRRGLGATAAVVTVALVAVSCVQAFDTSTGPLGEQRVYARLAPALPRLVRTLPEPIVVTGTGDVGVDALAASVLNGLVAAGADARFPDSLAWEVGAAHVVGADAGRGRLIVVYGDATARVARDPRYRVVAAVDELRPHARAELDRLRASFGGLAGEVRWARAHPAAARRLTALAQRSARATLVVPAAP